MKRRLGTSELQTKISHLRPVLMLLQCGDDLLLGKSALPPIEDCHNSRLNFRGAGHTISCAMIACALPHLAIGALRGDRVAATRGGEGRRGKAGAGICVFTRARIWMFFCNFERHVWQNPPQMRAGPQLTSYSGKNCPQYFRGTSRQ